MCDCNILITWVGIIASITIVTVTITTTILPYKLIKNKFKLFKKEINELNEKINNDLKISQKNISELSNQLNYYRWLFNYLDHIQFEKTHNQAYYDAALSYANLIEDKLIKDQLINRINFIKSHNNF